jgi:hypothetical protein
VLKTALEQAVAGVIPPLVIALGGMLCALVAYAISFIKSRTKNDKVAGALDRLNEVVSVAVKDAQQRIVGAIKPGDSLSAVLAEAKTTAIATIKSHYGEEGIAELKKILGWEDVDASLSNHVEAQVHDLKMDKAAAGLDSPFLPKPLPLPPAA